ncbi:MAG TPA: hypothetical protein VHV51_15145 [Polyangiaceae bacterium]|jgi:hypothetical protein|nr:hypothetical protein [Polyangiaceae bacterium]
MNRVLFGLFMLSACHATTTVPSARQPDGSWQLKCGNALDRCVQRANEICENRGYVVLGGMNKRSLYGAADGISQTEVREAELSIACADRKGEFPKVLLSNTLAPPPATTVVLAAPPPAAPTKPATACTPGATQQCVGPAACAGGQSCLPDGSGFSACDCGNATSKSAAPSKP